MQRSFTSNTTNMMNVTLSIVTDRMLGTQNSALTVLVAPESVNLSLAPEKLAPPLNSHNYKPQLQAIATSHSYKP